jgi:dephospho-CoA kinase
VADFSDIKRELSRIKAESPVPLIGLTGGIATGKSTVSKLLVEKGASVIDFDLLSREVTLPHMHAYKEILKEFGDAILDENGLINRKALGAMVFKDQKIRKRLEEITHPRIFEHYLNRLMEILSKQETSMVVADVPLLIEGGHMDLFHLVVLVYCTLDNQIKRLMERNKISEREAMSIIKAQMPIDEKVNYSHIVISNNGSISKLKESVDCLWKLIIQRKPLTKIPHWIGV